MVKREAPLSFRVYITLLLSRPRQDGCIREDGLKVNELAATNDQAGRRLQLDLYAYSLYVPGLRWPRSAPRYAAVRGCMTEGRGGYGA
jgi:hypothetical protein